MGRRIPRVLYLPDRPTGQFRTIAHGNYGQFLPPYAANVERVAAYGTPVMDRDPRSPNPEIPDTISSSKRAKSGPTRIVSGENRRTRIVNPRHRTTPGARQRASKSEAGSARWETGSHARG